MTLKSLIVTIALAAAACEGRTPDSVDETPPAVPNVAAAPSSKPAPVVPMPKDQAELDRLILAGYSPHGKHLHSPGVNECPLIKGNEAVM